jgi:hypothetical protein
MSEYGGFGGPTPWGGMTEHLNTLVSPPTTGPAPLLDMTSILHDAAQHFQLDLDQAPQAIIAFRQAAREMRDLMYETSRLADIPAPGLDAVSVNAAREIGQWAIGEEPGSLRWALDSGAIQLEQAADALERSLATHQNNDEANAAHLRRSEL